jgi:anaerobic dimethyl sulfoxide reductase subunit B (iron-sulfur subunit)
MTKAVFTIDIARCTGCQACSIACKDRADLPDKVDWMRVEAHEGGSYPQPTLYYRVVHCFHCARPSCVDACSAGAINRDEHGLVQIDDSLCSACGACVEACPFRAIVLEPEGTAAKCDGCPEETTQGWEPTCVRACPTRALAYGPTVQDLPGGRIADPQFDDYGIGPAVRYWRRGR